MRRGDGNNVETREAMHHRFGLQLVADVMLGLAQWGCALLFACYDHLHVHGETMRGRVVGCGVGCCVAPQAGWAGWHA